MANAENVEYWGAIIFAAVIAIGALFFLYLSQVTSRYASGISGGSVYDESAGALVTHEGYCVAPMRLTKDSRLEVMVDGKFPFMIDTAFDFNVVCPELDEAFRASGRIPSNAGGGESMTVITTTRKEAKRTVLPAGSLTAFGKCPYPASDRTIVSNSAPDPFKGILGRAFLESPVFRTVLLDVPNNRIVFNVPPVLAGKVLYTTRSRDPRFGLYLIDVDVSDRTGGRSFSGKFVLDTGARSLIVDQQWTRQLKWSGGRTSTLNMSGHLTSTMIHSVNILIPGTSSTQPMQASFVQHGAGENTILNRSDGPAGLLGIEALKDFKILIDNRTQSLSLLQ